MPSLRSAAKSLDPTAKIISTRSLAQKVSLQPPISLRRLNDIPRLSVLTGYAVPIKIKVGPISIDTGLDHTYVKSDNPSYTWPCWGGSSDGKVICQGKGDFSIAKHISQASPQIGNGTAGIIYGVTGVCHQTANRILYPARVIVSKARGYKLSYLAYGTYGLDSLNFFKWLEGFLDRLFEVSSKAVDPADTALLSTPVKMDIEVQSHSKDDMEESYIQKVVSLYTEQMQTSPGFNARVMSKDSSTIQGRGFESFNSMVMNEKNTFLLGKEFELMMESRLGGNLDPKITELVLKQQSNFLKEKGKMDLEFYSTDFNIEKYVKEVNDLFGDLLVNLPDILGKDEYEKIFDLSPLDKGFVLIDPDMAVNAHKQILKESIQTTA